MEDIFDERNYNIIQIVKEIQNNISALKQYL